jgi:hypothetical protein
MLTPDEMKMLENDKRVFGPEKMTLIQFYKQLLKVAPDGMGAYALESLARCRLKSEERKAVLVDVQYEEDDFDRAYCICCGSLKGRKCKPDCALALAVKGDV